VGSARLAALDYELPATAVTDEELAASLGIDVSAVADLARGRARHLAPDGEGPADLAARAVTRVLERQGLGYGDLDLIVFATNTPDYTFPGSACVLQGILGMSGLGAMDVRAHCVGFLAALDVAARFVATDTYQRVLVVAGDVPSHMVRLDGRDPQLACLTADAAAVALVEAGSGPGEILTAVHATDGRLHRQLWCAAPASRRSWGEGIARGMRITHDDIAEGRIYPTVDLSALRETALARVPEAFAAALAAAGLDRVEATVVCHLDPGTGAGRIIRSELLYSLAAALPSALARAQAAGQVASPCHVALTTAGSGASWGTAIVRL
jgi:3-oxoacyl-[acyl-carrier-protein] synthase-3